MIQAKDFPTIEARLKSALQDSFESVDVRMGNDLHYRGTNIVITSQDFAGLLPEQRFNHVVRALPADLYDSLRSGIVWFELAPGEPALDYMKMPRSEDIADQETAVLKRLTEVKFFKKFESALMSKRQAPSRRDFVIVRRVLGDLGLSRDEITRSCLFFIRHGGYSDAQVFSHVMEELAGSHTDESRLHSKASSTKPGAKMPD